MADAETCLKNELSIELGWDPLIIESVVENIKQARSLEDVKDIVDVSSGYEWNAVEWIDWSPPAAARTRTARGRRERARAAALSLQCTARERARRRQRAPPRRCLCGFVLNRPRSIGI